jgi:hypothetical protein
MEKTIRQKIEPQAKEILETYRLWGFKFNSVNFGQAPPRIEGLKVKKVYPGKTELGKHLFIYVRSQLRTPLLNQ